MSQESGSLFRVASSLIPRLKNYFHPNGPHVAKFLGDISKRRCRPVALTCAGKTDGGGAQVQAVMSVLAFCRAFGYSYAHTPFRQIEHTANSSEIAAWEGLFNLGAGETPVSEFKCPVVPVELYVKSPCLWSQRVIVSVQHLHAFVDSRPAACQAIRDDLRRKYAASSPPVQPRDRLTVAVHMRRGDVDLATHKIRFTTNAAIAARIRHIRRVCEDARRPCEITVHSQGRREDFSDLAAEGCLLKLNANPLESLNELIAADMLVMAKSSFSYVAGVLSKGIVIYEPFWHAPLPDWLDTNDLGLLERRVAAHEKEIQRHCAI